MQPDTLVPLPSDGQEIRYRRKGQPEWKTGTVAFCWLALDEAAIDIEGGGTIIPAFGDEWMAVVNTFIDPKQD